MKTIKLAPGERLVTNQLNRKGVLPRNIVDAARDIVANVRANGDAAVRDYCQRFDGVELQSFRLPQEQIDAALEGLDPAFVAALEKAARQIREFHQREVEQSWFTTRADGTMLGVKVTPLAAAGIYVPGGRAQYPSTVLMNAIPAKVAGVKRVVMVTPPQKDGLISPYTLAAAKLGGVDEIYMVGGAQAVAALAYGTESIPRVDKITGPGNAFVAAAKQIVSGDVGIDMVAGPSEVCVLADATAKPMVVAADLMAQAEHDPLAACYLVTCDEQFAREVEDGNEGAIALYAALGFTEVGRRRGYYGVGKDAIVMTAPLPLVLPVDNASPEPTAAEQRVWPLPAPGRSEGERAEIERRRLVLAIESSCDETAVAIIDADGNMLANQVSTQIDFHARFGGVVPEIASRKHVEVIVSVVDAALEDAAASLGLEGGAIAPSELAAVGVTQGPGLVGALVVGVAFAKGFAYAAGKPLVCVNHLEGHLFANLLAQPDLKPPFIFTLVSGGHTMLVHVKAWGDYEVLGETLDDAVGEAFDKVAKALGLGYPGGPIISKLAETGNPKAIDFPRALNSRGDYRFSLSGLKTAVTLYIEQETKAGRTIHLPDLAASFEAAVFDVQYKKAKNALHATGCKEYCIGGGVSANPHLREMMIKKLGRQGIRVTVPPLSACTDNAAMIAEVARRKFDRGEISPFDVDADPNMTL